MNSKKKNVDVSAEAFVSMAIHAGQNPTNEVHGLLLGSSNKDMILVTKAVPVCHEIPTKPLLETALSLASSSEEDLVIIGWYTAPKRLDDKHPGPVPLRIAANLPTSDVEPVLLMIDNDALALCLTDENPKDDVVKGFGKDFGQQWLEPLSLSVTNEKKAFEAATSAFSNGIPVVDLVDHFEDTKRDWIGNNLLATHVAKIV
eukprot:CAMPEP_0194234202 /NCGR_PEP_ID=MMETSP0158-20130606/1974_1 /TAXON_ID=33649 /ORGANISM="Thalassionema nitzschioides, Strain L26-B" /LENGTH=201 /DNA_ID=CAMNT_0038967303 /DNA_START=32 /DNA_END=633 /DNA_ORIENTATION=-